ncbi:MAG: choline-sulfatase, partial [Gammaproteobacteria bacterium]
MSSFVPRSLLLLSALVPLSACGGAPDVPSILLITLDTTRQDALSCYGAIPGLTPSVDRIAAEGITYLQAHTVAPITLPSHTSMLTGLWPPRHGLRINGAASLPAEAETLAELASGLGLETAAFLSAAVLGSTFALDQGFDVYDEVDTHKEKASNSFPRRNGRATIDAAL